jgi:hypothetical protein
MHGRSGHHLAGWAALVAATALLVVAQGCSGGSSRSGPHRDDADRPNIEVTAADFPNINSMTRVRGFFVDNLLGDLDETLAVANDPKGGSYPAGTLIQLVPQEAMIKQRPGFDAATRDWEFFFLETTEQGTKILKRGTDDVVNRFNGNCASCHAAADKRFDMVCETSHGCEPLPVGHDMIEGIQAGDPRPMPGS